MSNLSARMVKSRRFKFEIDGHTLILERPTMYDMVRMNADGYSHNEIAKKFVVDWQGVRECELIKGGAAEEIPFDREAWEMWLDENGEWWSPIGLKVIEAFSQHIERKEAAQKK